MTTRTNNKARRAVKALFVIALLVSGIGTGNASKPVRADSINAVTAQD